MSAALQLATVWGASTQAVWQEERRNSEAKTSGKT